MSDPLEITKLITLQVERIEELRLAEKTNKRHNARLFREIMTLRDLYETYQKINPTAPSAPAETEKEATSISADKVVSLLMMVVNRSQPPVVDRVSANGSNGAHSSTTGA